MKYQLFTDGGARGNPGPAASGWLAIDLEGNVVNLGGEFLGETTNNFAEYSALKLALSKLLKTSGVDAGASDLICHLDSELVVKQLQGVYKIKEPQLQILAAEVKELSIKFKQVQFVHVPREQNRAADKLVNLILDTKLA